jgi:hypothetical protein
MMRAGIGGVVLGVALGMAAATEAPAQTAAERVVLAPHRAVYDLKLDPAKPARNVDSATGRIAFDFNGDACEGYALSFRQVTVLQGGEGGARQIDVRTSNFEDGEGKLFRYRTQSLLGGRVEERNDGTVELRDGKLVARITQPKPASHEFSAEVTFPSEHLKRIIRAARAGQTTLNVQVYDGSDDGKQIYDTLAVIGRRLGPGPLDALEEAVRKPELAALARWPVTISYFKQGSGEQTPSYAIGFEIFENGITRALKLDYRDFRMTGDLVRLDTLPLTACAK